MPSIIKIEAPAPPLSGTIAGLSPKEYDTHTRVRDQIEANVADVYARWPGVWAARSDDASANDWLSNALRAAYQKVAPDHNKDRARMEDDEL